MDYQHKNLAAGKENLKRLIESNTDLEKIKNEAETRFHIIDEILQKSLFWTKEYTSVERFYSGNYTDYELGKPKKAIWEAKREGVYFELPANFSKKIRVNIPSILAVSTPAKDAIDQVRKYCSERGVQIAVITNGFQIIAFLATRSDGVPPLEGEAIVFDSLDHLYQNFDKAWQFLSFDGVQENKIIHYLTSGNIGIPQKLSSKLVEYPKVRYSTDLRADLKQLSELLILDIIENQEIEEEFYKRCYCESGALTQHALLSKNILNARYASLFNNSEESPFVQPINKNKNETNITPDLLSNSISKRPIVLIGDVGVGKTSFVKNLMYVSAFDEFKNALYLYIDLGAKATLTNNLSDYILNEISDQLESKYEFDINELKFIKGTYASEISKFSKGIWGTLKESDKDKYEEKLFTELQKHIDQKDQHLKRSIQHLAKARHQQIIISIDNADQRDFDVQQEAFIISQELAKDWSAVVFIAVRPQTFYKSKRSGALTAYPHKVFTISPPRVDEMIESRLAFALDMAEGKLEVRSLEFTLQAKNLVLFLKALIISLKKNQEIHTFLSNITGGNVRSVLDLVTRFIGSPNVDAEKIIDIMSWKGSYFIPLHEFTKSALLGDFSHYNPDTSIAMNVYDINSPDTKSHFLVPMMIAYLDETKNNIDKDGFILTGYIIDEFQSLGFDSRQIEDALRRTTNKKLIETSQRITFEEDETGLIGNLPSSFRITTVGAYHLKRWLPTFTYLDAMVFDTPLFDSKLTGDLVSDIDSFRIEDRLNRAILFRKYLLDAWVSSSNNPPYFNFEQIIESGDDTFNTIKQVVDNNSTTKGS